MKVFMIINIIKTNVKYIIRPQGKYSFLRKIDCCGKILDVGCGNNSAFAIKSIFPRFHYTGVDIGDYNQTKPNLADNYILTEPERFSLEIGKFVCCFDAVVSSHNIEHCDDRPSTMKAMLDAVRVGGLIYLSFPCEASVNFPCRMGTLNYYDDGTHRGVPPNFDEMLLTLKEDNFEVIFSSRNYRPLLLRILGFLYEPFSRLQSRVLLGTWNTMDLSLLFGRKNYEIVLGNFMVHAN